MAGFREGPKGDGSAGAGDRRRHADGKGRNAALSCNRHFRIWPRAASLAPQLPR
jgi:hypothetical protein